MLKCLKHLLLACWSCIVSSVAHLLFYLQQILFKWEMPIMPHLISNWIMPILKCCISVHAPALILFCISLFAQLYKAEHTWLSSIFGQFQRCNLFCCLIMNIMCKFCWDESIWFLNCFAHASITLNFYLIFP